MKATVEPNAFYAGEAVTIQGMRCLPAGDRFYLLELGQEMDLAVNLRAIQLANRIVEEKIAGIIETLPMFISVLVHYNSVELDPRSLLDRVAGIWAEISAEADVTVPSRLIEVPVYYGDPWTQECVADYARNIKPIEDDLTYVARLSGLSREAFARRHAFSQHWVGGVGFWPGLPDMMPLDPRCQHSIPKYDPPRLWTVPCAIGVGGGFTSIYPMNTPGGYHLIGRTPIPIFSLDTRLAAFRERATLFEPGDRIKFQAIDEPTYVEISEALKANAYRFSITDMDLFSLSRYRKWAESVKRLEGTEVLPW
jgi:urea carboxylase